MRKYSFLLCFIVVAMACGGIKTYQDYDETVNFAQYRNFEFYEDMETGLSDLDEKRFKSAIDSVLEEKDFSNDDNPDFKINLYSETYQKDNRSALGIGLGTIGHNVSGNINSGVPIGRLDDMLSLTIEFVDAESNNLFWQGVVEGKFNKSTAGEDRKKIINEMAEKALGHFPPKSH